MKIYSTLQKLMLAALVFYPSQFITAQTATSLSIYQSSERATPMLQQISSVNLTPDPDTEVEVVNIYPELKYQEIFGFGGAITETSAYNFMQLSASQRERLAQLYFDREKGIGANFCRTHINSADFSVSEYTYVKDNDTELKSFSIAPDKKYIIPMIKEAKKYSPDLYLFASPWSPPAWMKDNKSMIHGGKLLPSYYATWANYFAKYLTAYHEEGINFFAVTVQNEPKASQTWESCYYTATDEANFAVKNLRPTLDKAGFENIRIIIWDHNKERVLDRAKESFAVDGALNAIWGVGFHWYSGEHFDALRLTHEVFPDKPLILTEFCRGESRNTQNIVFSDWKDMESYANELIGDLNNYTSAIVDWNMIVDMKGGPYHNRTSGCKAGIVVDAAKDAFYIQPIYYAIGHFSKFIQRGAKRIGSSSYSDNVKVAAFQNPDGKIVVVLLNCGDKDISPRIRIAGNTAPVPLPGKSLTTIVM